MAKTKASLSITPSDVEEYPQDWDPEAHPDWQATPHGGIKKDGIRPTPTYTRGAPLPIRGDITRPNSVDSCPTKYDKEHFNGVFELKDLKNASSLEQLFAFFVNSSIAKAQAGDALLSRFRRAFLDRELPYVSSGQVSRISSTFGYGVLINKNNQDLIDKGLKALQLRALAYGGTQHEDAGKKEVLNFFDYRGVDPKFAAGVAAL